MRRRIKKAPVRPYGWVGMCPGQVGMWEWRAIQDEFRRFPSIAVRGITATKAEAEAAVRWALESWAIPVTRIEL